jgi:hypothetical protein
MRVWTTKLRWIAVAGVAFSTAAWAQSEPWDRLQEGDAVYAGTIDDRKNAIEFICSATGEASLVVKSPQFRVSVPDDYRYTLTFVTDHGRSELVATAKDADLIFAAGDLNARIALERLIDDIGASRSFKVAMSPFGWHAEFSAEGAAAALKGLLDKC